VFGIGSGLAWAGISVGANAAQREAQRRRQKKGTDSQDDIGKRVLAQREAEQNMYITAPGAPAIYGTPSTTGGTMIPITQPSAQLLCGFTDPGQLPARFIAVIAQRQFSASVDVFRDGKVDGGNEGQHWEVIRSGPEEFMFRCVWNGCYLAISKKIFKTKASCSHGQPSAQSHWTLVIAPEHGAGAFCLRASNGDFLCMDAGGKISMSDKLASDAHKQTVFRFMYPS